MSSDENTLLKKISVLESQLDQKDLELKKYKQEIIKANQVLETLSMQLNEQLKMASLIQKKLSPTEFPNITGLEFSSKFVPGTKSGGDYFDIFELEDKFRFAVLLASSSGYGMSALLMSVVFRLASRMEARKGMPPHEVIDLMAKEILREKVGTDRASLFYGIIDRRTFEMQYSIAGQIRGLHLPHNGQMQVLSAGSGFLAQGFVAPLESHQIQLNSKDRFVLCTEGITDAMNLEGEKFGPERLIAAAQSAPKSGVHELRNELIYKAEQFSGKTEFDRDLSIIVTEVKDKVIKLTKRD